MMRCRCGIVTSSTVNGHVRWNRVPIQCHPSHRPQRTPSTTTSIATRATTVRPRAAKTRAVGCSASACSMRTEYHSCRVEPMPLDSHRTVLELRDLQQLTGDENGAQRVAWTETWERARDWLREKLGGLPLEEEIDQAGNQWWTLRGGSDRTVLIGGHIDSVPNGGWLDGALNVVAGVEVMRRLAESEPATTVRLVNWSDEEGARFGRSLFGSSAAAGSMDDQDELRERRDADGVALPDAVGAYDVDLDSALEARSQLEGAAAYLELHIEQGPVLESLGLPLGVVLGTFGVERHQVTF